MPSDRPSRRAVTLDDLRRHAVARSLFRPTTLARAIARLGFVQADPIRAPARAQDLTLRHRVAGHLAGDLERRYPRLAIDEDCLVNYGFLPREHLALMHPRTPKRVWDPATEKRAADLLAFIRERGTVHPRDIAAAFDHGRTTNYWGGSGSATTHLLDAMHYRGLLRVAQRVNGTRLYQAAHHAPADTAPAARARCADALIDLIVRKYAPLPATSLRYLVRLLGYGAPQLAADSAAALQRAHASLANSVIDRVHWYWPSDERPTSQGHAIDDQVRLLAPFDPVVWDRTRFELLWGWTYRFEAYIPAPKRQLGYYALPLLWRDQVIGWANASVADGRLKVEIGHASGRAPRDAVFRRELEAELDRLRVFLGLDQ